MSTSGVFERRSRTISLSHGGYSRAEVRGIPLLTLSISDLRKRKFLRNPKIFVVQDDLWCWHIPGPEFFACRVRRRVGRPFSIEEKPSMPTQPLNSVTATGWRSHCTLYPGHCRERTAGFIAAGMRRRDLHRSALVLPPGRAGARIGVAV